MDKQWDNTDEAMSHMIDEHVTKMGSEEPPAKETAKQWAFGGSKNETWSETAKRWGKALENLKNKNIGR